MCTLNLPLTCDFDNNIATTKMTKKEVFYNLHVDTVI